MRASLFFLLFLLNGFVILAQKDFGPIRQWTDTTGSLPWTNLAFNDSPDQFQFAIVTDRTGGARPGVFLKGVHKLNLLQPEFVMSVGDLIQGYTQDTVELNRQWKEFKGFVEQLDMPFFYVPGNHDITNPVMEKLWLRQFGTTYYHFLYRDVLFLCLNSEDNIRGAGRGTIDDEQYEYIKQVLADHPDVRWTLLFMHQPLWQQEAETKRWPDVEKLLEGRPHTVFAGHRHRYVSFERNQSRYIMLATTGGGSPLRGPEFGEFDHVVWVTMTPEGPILANLWLEGIFDADLMTEAGREFIDQIARDLPLRVTPLFWIAGKPFRSGATRIKLVNDRDIPMKIHIDDRFSWDFTSDLSADTLTVPPNSVEFVEARLSTRKGAASNGGFVRLEAGIGYDMPGMPKVKIPQHLNLGPVEAFQLETTDERIQIDGQLEEWDEWPYLIEGDQSEDAAARFQLKLGEDHLYVAAKITDDQIVSDTGTVAWQQDHVSLVVNADPLEISSLRTGSGWYRNSFLLQVSPAHGDMPASIFNENRYSEDFPDWVCRASEGGYVFEAAIPLSYIIERQGEDWRSIRVNFSVQDRDEGQEERPTYHWQPSWRESDNVIGSGTFFRAPVEEVQEIAKPLETGDR